MGYYAYITDAAADKVFVINTATDIIIADVAVGSDPYGVAVMPDGSKIYVTNQSAGTVSVINAATNTVTNTITVGSDPVGVAITPDGTKAFVSNSGSDNVSVINTATNGLITTVSVGNEPWGIAVTNDGAKAYVANLSSLTVTVSEIDTTSYAVTTFIISAHPNPMAVAASPTAALLFVTIAESPGYLVKIDTSNNTVLGTLTIGNDPQGVTVSPDGATVYVTNAQSNTITIVDVAAWTQSGRGVGNFPIGVSVTPDNKVCVANRSSQTVSAIDQAGVLRTITGFSAPIAFGMFVSPINKSYPLSIGSGWFGC